MEYEKSNIARLVGCVTALHSFSQIRAQLIVAHAISLEPYLNIKCTSNEQIKFLALLAEILEQVVPLMEHPGDAFLSDLEAHLMTLIVTQRQMVVHSCVACLGAVINKMTKNYPLIRECFAKVYTRALVYTKERMIRDPNLPSEQIYTPVFRRGIFTVGLLMRFFDFSRVDVNGSNTNERNRLSPNICDEIFETLLYFLNSNIQPIQREILQALGYFCVTNCEYLTRPELREYYNHLLSNLSDQNELKIMVLKNILLYLMEEEIKMTKNDKEWQVQSKTEDLKEMCDISSGMSSRVIQIYLKEILNSFLNGDFSVRLMAMRVVEIVLRQGLVHPVQIVPYLICLSTDPETEASHSADRHLQEIDKQYQGFVNMKCQQGVQLSYHLQSMIQKKTNGRAARGYRLPKAGLEEPPSALNGFVYSLLRNTKPNRRALVGSMTKQFDDEKSTLSFMLYLADNLAYFPYVVQDEPLYLIHQIDLFISVTGTNLLQNFRDGLKPKPGDENKEKENNPLEDEDDEEDRDALYERLPDNTTDLQQCITSAQGCMLLLILKQHLKDMYGINDAKIAQYSPSESTKIYDKAMQRRPIQPFNPKATIAILKEDPKAGDELTESQKRVLVDRYLEFKQLMIKLDPDEEDEEDDDNKPLVKQSMRNQAVTSESLNANGNSSTLMADPVVNNVHLNNVQINLTRVNLPPEYQNFEKAINVNSIPKPQTQKPSKAKSTPSKKSSSKKKRRKLSSSEDDEESDFDDDDYD
jgi:cohesin loading factor subunit SCC2